MPHPSTPQGQGPQRGRLRRVRRLGHPSALSLALVLAATLVPSAQAVTIYNESVGGDLRGDQGSPTALGSLQTGLNTVIGFDSQATDTIGTGQGDGFQVTLGSGQSLSAVTFTATNYTGTDSYVVTFFRAPSPAFTFRVYQRFGPLTGTPTLQFNIPPGLSTESLGFSLQLATANDPATSISWRWDVQTTSPVPEPATAGLLLAGLVGLGLAAGQQRRRRQASTPGLAG